MEGQEEPQPEEEVRLQPVKTCFVVCRDIPITVKAQLIIIRAERGWDSWADMVYDVVREWGPAGEIKDEGE